jgi:hypothetical protein
VLASLAFCLANEEEFVGLLLSWWLQKPMGSVSEEL